MIWVIGAQGILGSCFRDFLTAHDIPHYATDKELDVCDYAQLWAFSENKKISYIINCSAYTDVERAESESERAFQINSYAVENIARIAQEKQAMFCHFSTDYLFDISPACPLMEDDSVQPVNVYAASKWDGEQRLRSILREYFIFRTSWLYGKTGTHFVYTMLRLMNEQESLRVVSDQWGSPTWAVDLVQAVMRVISVGSEFYGTYHFSGEGETNWYEYAQEIYRYGKETGLISRDCTLIPVTTAEYGTVVARPRYSYLSKEKIQRTFQITPPYWKTSLHHFLDTLVDI